MLKGLNYYTYGSFIMLSDRSVKLELRQFSNFFKILYPAFDNVMGINNVDILDDNDRHRFHIIFFFK